MTDPTSTGWAAPESTPPGVPSPVPGTPGQPPAGYAQSQTAYGQPQAAYGQPPVLAPVAAPRKKGSNWTNVLLVVAAVVAVGGIAFAAGRMTAPASTTRARAGQFPTGSFAPGGATGQGGPGGFARSGTFRLSGTVTAINGTSMTMQTANGETITVDLSGSTYHTQAAATASDVTTGSTVEVSTQGFPGGFRQGDGAAPGASAAPNTGGSGGAGITVKATDVTVVPKS